MIKHNIIKKLAVLYGIKLEFFDLKGNLHKVKIEECRDFLNSIGINTDSAEIIEEQLNNAEFQLWNKWLQPVQVIKQPDLPVIKLRIANKELNKSFNWLLREENGQLHEGSFTCSELTVTSYKSFKKKGTFIQLEIPLPVTTGIGYHSFKLKSAANKEASTTIIVTPEKCYKPSGIIKRQTIKGPDIKKSSASGLKIKDFDQLEEIVKLLSKEKADTIAVGPINQFSVNSLINNDTIIPSSRMLFNTLYLNIDAIINYIDEKSVKIALYTSEYKEHLKKILESDETDYKAIYDLKYQALKLIYQSFREYNINVNSPKSQEFYYFKNKHKSQLHKLALFEALQEYFNTESPEYNSWHDWPDAYKNPDSDVVKSFAEQNIELIEFYEFMQWLADVQLNSAALQSYEKGLAVGIYTDLQFNIDPNGADAWLYQNYYAFSATSTPYYNMAKQFKDKSLFTPPLIPHKLYENAYSHFIDYLRPNMIHSGAININNLKGLDHLHWHTNDDIDNKGFYVIYPFEDLIGIIALESHKNKCLITTDNYQELTPKIKQVLIQYGILTQQAFELKEVADKDEVKELFTYIDTETKADQNADRTKTDTKNDRQIAKIPDSTYRLQFNKYFTFKQATEIVPYLKSLGISHCYASPILCARPDSMHGYDIIDHNSINPALGSIHDYYNFIDALHKHNMGLIVDIVPNHMGISKENKWWIDVLENGKASEYAKYFDIDWKPIKKELWGKVLVPVLGNHYGNILANGELKFNYSEQTGKISLHYYEHMFPINPSSYPLILEYRLEVLESRLGSSNLDYLEYQSILSEFKNLPTHAEENTEKIEERIREKNIAFRRLRTLSKNNQLVSEFIYENLKAFESHPEDPLTQKRLHNLLEEQAYRLAYWRVSADEINYRRFFDVNDLAGICTNKPAVFISTHSLILDLIEQRTIDGLRIDHPDGLFDPTKYFYKLQEETSKRLDIAFNPTDEVLCGSEKLPFYVVAEKILAPFERPAESWAIHGTVGYEFLNSVCNLFVKPENEKKFDKIYYKFINKNIDFHELVIECKKLIMKSSLTGELNVLSNYINNISENYYISRDYTLNSLRDSIVEIIAHFPVYRTYINETDKSNKDIDYIKWAVGSAKKRSLSTDPSIYDFIERILLTEYEEDKESLAYKQILEFAMKFQQYTGPLMAKGLEDTSFYRYNRLIALNEVGGEPNNFGITTNEFHNININRISACPNNMLCTSTHDTKRSEDVRARLCVLSEIPDKWQKVLNRLSQLNKTKKTKIDKAIYPSKNDEYLFYQTLTGIWPYHVVEDKELNSLIQRIETYMLKAIREAKEHTSWVNVNEAYEEAICNFIRRVLTSPYKHPFWKEFLPFQREVALRGFINSISQTLLKLTCPGVPDIYQGNETLRFSLVDPDNRRPVNFSELKQQLESIRPLLFVEDEEAFLKMYSPLLTLSNGLLKLFITTATLNFRLDHTDLFTSGSYIPLDISGNKTENLVAYARQNNNEAVITIIPKFVYNLVSKENPLPVSEEIWTNNNILIPDELKDYKWQNIFTKAIYEIVDGHIVAGKMLSLIPVALIYGKK